MSVRHLMLQSDNRGNAWGLASVLVTLAAFPLAYHFVWAAGLPLLALALGYQAYRQHRRQWRRPDDASAWTPLLPMLLAVLAQVVVVILVSARWGAY
ncbi:MAG: hypothetical protein C4K60_03370 [Ideonella sp. MAG2]|nr:MAG: hypothetical protein C4K60_03370 [Ideonella sp. MAG2]